MIDNISFNKANTHLSIPSSLSTEPSLERPSSWCGRYWSKTLKSLDPLVQTISKCLLGLALFTATPLSASSNETAQKAAVEDSQTILLENISSASDFKHQFIVRSLAPNDWERFRDLRLKALNENPIAYGIAVSDEANRTDEEWKSICDSAYHGNGKWYFVAEVEGELIGIVGAHEQYGAYMRHLVEIVGAYVAPEFRRSGVMAQLCESLKNRLLEEPHVEQLISWVTLHEHQSGKYVSEYFGFKYAGKLSRCVKYGEHYYDCCWLEASLK